MGTVRCTAGRAVGANGWPAARNGENGGGGFRAVLAAFSPACGRASGAFSIFTVNAGRAAVAASTTGRPVNGYCAGTVVVVAGGFGRARTTSFFLLPPQAPATSTRATTAAMGRRTDGSELLERLDALFEGRVGLEQTVQSRQTAFVLGAGE